MPVPTSRDGIYFASDDVVKDARVEPGNEIAYFLPQSLFSVGVQLGPEPWTACGVFGQLIYSPCRAFTELVDEFGKLTQLKLKIRQ